MRSKAENTVSIKPLVVVPELMPAIRAWFETEWPEHYGPGGYGNATQDLLCYCNAGSVPLGLVAFMQGQPCGFAAIKSEPFPSHPLLSPWVGAGYVVPPLRRQGIGQAMLRSLELHARQIGLAHLYCATTTAASLLQRCGWQLLEVVLHETREVAVYERAL